MISLPKHWLFPLAITGAALAVALALAAEPEVSVMALVFGVPVSIWVRRHRLPRWHRDGQRDVTPAELPLWIRDEIAVHWNADQRLVERRARDAHGRGHTEWLWLDEDGDVINVFGPPH